MWRQNENEKPTNIDQTCVLIYFLNLLTENSNGPTVNTHVLVIQFPKKMEVDKFEKASVSQKQPLSEGRFFNKSKTFAKSQNM